MKYWFALLVKPRHEKAVAAALRSKHFEEFLPLRSVRRKWSDRFKVVEVPLLAGYAFCRFEPCDKVRILRTPGVRKVVGWGATPVPVEETEIQALQTVMQAGLPPRRVRSCARDNRSVSIAVRSAASAGAAAESRGRSRLVVSVTLLQRSVAVEVEQAWISPANWSEALTAAPANREPHRGAGMSRHNRRVEQACPELSLVVPTDRGAARASAGKPRSRRRRRRRTAANILVGVLQECFGARPTVSRVWPLLRDSGSLRQANRKFDVAP